MLTEKITKLMEVAKKAKDPDFKRIWEDKIRQLIDKELLGKTIQ
jgi:hypothetical protein